MTQTRICLICNKEYLINSAAQKRCPKCQHLKCLYCGKIYKTKTHNYRQKYCSRRCALLGNPEHIKVFCSHRGSKPRNRKISQCLVCGIKFEHWAGRDSKYCSIKCWSIRNPKILNQCLFCGKDFWDHQSKQRVYCSVKCNDNHRREWQKGSGSHFWRGGKTKLSHLERSRAKYLEWRNAVFIRDDYTCKKCGIKSGCGHRIYLQAHHKKSFSEYPELRYDIDNGITLCKNCHLLNHCHKF